MTKYIKTWQYIFSPTPSTVCHTCPNPITRKKLRCNTFNTFDAQWNKPSGEREMPYDLPYKWNLINKTNKRAKYNQKHWKREKQSHSVWRGEKRGMIGVNGGAWRNMYEGHMDKAKGGGFEEGRRWGCVMGGRGPWWGENEDKCTWTTIKNTFDNIPSLK